MYPDLMDGVVPISCQPIEISGRNWISRRAAADALYEQRLAQAAHGDANNSLWAIEAIMDYNPEPDLDKIKAKVLLINAEEDEANPPELGTVERAMKRVRHGRYVLIPASDKTHGHFTHFYAEVWKPYLIEFINTLAAPLQAAAE
jgi:homoserine O-acetyltransferase